MGIYSQKRQQSKGKAIYFSFSFTTQCLVSTEYVKALCCFCIIHKEVTFYRKNDDLLPSSNIAYVEVFVYQGNSSRFILQYSLALLCFLKSIVGLTYVDFAMLEFKPENIVYRLKEVASKALEILTAKYTNW